MDEWLVLLIAATLGFALGALTILGLRKRRPKAKAPAPEAHVAEFEPVDHFGVSHAPRASTPPPVPSPSPSPGGIPPRPLDESVVPTEWAARVTGPLPAGRVKGVCSGCGTPLSVSTNRPIRIACPECGRTRLLS